MIYEMTLVLKSGIGDTEVSSMKELVRSTISSEEGELFIEDDWGNISLAQATADGVEKGQFIYFIYHASNATNLELLRRFKISDHVLRSFIFKVGDTVEDRESVVKAYKTPYSKTYQGSVTDDLGDKGDSRERRYFSKKKNCWFKSNNIKADWKDPATFSWLVNEFGKISPARVSGISSKHQRFATIEIKKARQVGIASNVSARRAQSV